MKFLPPTLLTLLTAATTASTQYISILASRPNSIIHQQPLQAAGLALQLGGLSTHYCPPRAQAYGYCPDTVETNFLCGDGTCGMGALVPGGQDVYVDIHYGTARVKYSQAHENAVSWADDIENGWVVGNGTLAWEGGLVACGTTNGSGPFPVFAKGEGFVFGVDCLEFEMVATAMGKADAWQYT